MNRFRKYLTVVCTLVMIGTSFSAFANFLVVTPEQVSVTPEGLFVSINGISLAVESLNIANDGHIVAIPIPSPYAAICPNCGHDTYTPGRTCSTCGFPIWDGDMKIK
ncbi:MAG: hypothetical protein KR126chlam2_01061 [Chlamydiae bacterium]|nr:hypothetical protein [Chlamydiota bacterium]